MKLAMHDSDFGVRILSILLIIRLYPGLFLFTNLFINIVSLEHLVLVTIYSSLFSTSKFVSLKRLCYFHL